jgi:predicted nucleotidyltransferase
MIAFSQILAACREIASEYPGHVFIGGVAVYLHAMNNARLKESAEASHDADFMLSLTDFSDLRRTFEVTANRRLQKHQLIRDGIEFDVYVERQNGLTVPYDEAAAHAVQYGDMKVACLEHLLVLKLGAYVSRSQSSKGDKDARDLVTIARLGNKIRPRLIAPFLLAEHEEALVTISRSPVFMEIAENNAQRAKNLRAMFTKFAVTATGKN